MSDAVCCRISIWETRRRSARSSAPTSEWPELRSLRFISIRAFAFAWSSSRFSRCRRASPANDARRSLSSRSLAPASRFFSCTRSRSWRSSCASWFRASRFSKRLWSLISACSSSERVFFRTIRSSSQVGMRRLAEMRLTFRQVDCVRDSRDLLRRQLLDAARPERDRREDRVERRLRRREGAPFQPQAVLHGLATVLE